MEELNGRQNLVVGIIGGCVLVSMDHPLVSLKNMVQQSLPLSFNPRILYRGVIADMASVASITAIQFYSVGAIKNLIHKYKINKELNSNDILISSLGGGMLSGLACGPWELIMIQQQRYGGTLISHAYKLCTTNPFTLTRGLVPSMGREGIFTMGYLGVTPILEKYNQNNKGFIYKFGCAMLSGGAAVMLSHPLDTIKTCMQGDIQKQYFKGIYHSFNFLYSHYGLTRIYAGWKFRFCIMTLAIFTFNRVIEFIAPKIYPNQFEQFRLSRKETD